MIDLRVLGGYKCKPCKKLFIKMYDDPCWRPEKSYKPTGGPLGSPEQRLKR